MAVFLESEVECNKCGEKYKTFTGMDGISILYRSTILPLCAKCTTEIVELCGGVAKLVRPMSITKKSN